MEVIPVIIEKTFPAIARKIRLVESYVNWIQLDIADGIFVPNETWNNPEELNAGDFAAHLEAHLMIVEPEKHFQKWLNAGVKRIIAHIEAMGQREKGVGPSRSIMDMAEAVRRSGGEFGIAVNIETGLSSFGDHFASYLDLILVMTVPTGFGGQKFNEGALAKIKSLRQAFPHVKLEVDGGINPETAKKCRDAGADTLVAGSHIFTSPDVEAAIKQLQAV
ncbi:MAG: Ribulose-phosphate 3-epimerase [Parcubacteria group bacterium GW2011_GWA2_47_9]|nr:MAG: Ribulose-phosphate 3-epimerase [Parcubacteria group bacterium GW2011_GWA2_47_9]